MGDKVLFDTNSFIAPFNQYYAPDIVPSYWKQLLVSSPDIMVLDKVRDEIYRGKDELAKWLKSNINQFQVVSTDDLRIIEVYGQVIQSIADNRCYQPAAVRNWSDNRIADPWLIAAAKVYNCSVITFERSAIPTADSPSRNPKIPDVGRDFGVHCKDLYSYMRDVRMKI